MPHVNASGKVNITVNGNTTTIDLANGEETWKLRAVQRDAIVEYDGKATLNIYNLPVGEYPVEVTYLGNDNYNEATATAVFTVSQINTTLVCCFGCSSPQSRAQNPPDPITSAKESSPHPIEQTIPTQEPDSERFHTADVDISKVCTTRKLIALTFDDAPSKTTEEIIAAFLSYNVTHPDVPASATLFCNGKNLYPSTTPSLEVALTAGFELGNHTQNHKDLTTVTADELRYEIEETDRLLCRLDGKPIHLLRTPYGAMNEEIKRAAHAPIINWFVDTLDWTGISADAIYDKVWQGKGDGVIVLLHDGYPNTVTALRRLLPDLYNAGYQAVTVSQMAKAHHCNLKIGGIYTRARDLSKQ